nr:interleukin-17 receptor E [Solea senegalensis]
MFLTCVDTTLALFALMVFPLLLECTTTCQTINQSDYVEGPVKLTPVVVQGPGEAYSECITLRVWMKAHDICKTPKIEILSRTTQTFWPVVKKGKKKNKCINAPIPAQNGISCVKRKDYSPSSHLWEFKYDCIKAEAERVVSVTYSTASTPYTVNYTVPDPVPEFELSVNRSSKSVTVTVQLGKKVHTMWCYRNTYGACMGDSSSSQITIDPSKSPSAVLNLSYLLPCVCVQVYYTYTDARRKLKCPFLKESLSEVGDVWRSSEVTLYETGLTWSSLCPASNMNVSAALCWKQRDHLCIPVLNSTLEEKDGDGSHLIFDTSAVDKHPDMCVQFSLQGSHNITCPFQADVPSWEVDIGLSKKSVFVSLTSAVSAEFSSQLCVVSEDGCSPLGPVHTLRLEGKPAEMKINMPADSLVQKPCVQVWQSDPALHGKRILCWDYTHHRRGMYAFAALILVVVFASLGVFIYRLTRSGAAGWLYVQKPVLLVCSSEQSAHVSAVCALASLLQGELNATVHTALWAQSSQSGTGTRTGVADLGPLPWLYGQWESVRRAEGKVLIIWSHEATTSYEKWKTKRENTDKKEEYKKGGEDCDEEDWYQQREPSSVIAPMFAGALACLQGALQQSKGQGVAIVYFQGLGHSRDIPKAFREVPRYCLPQDFRGLIQELGGIKRRTNTQGQLKTHCWPRVLAKVQSIWLARQLAHRLQTLLPQTAGRGRRAQRRSVASSKRKISDKKPGELERSLAANGASPEAAHEREPLHGSRLRAEEL